MAAADTLYEVMSLMVKKGPLSAMVEDQEVEVEANEDKHKEMEVEAKGAEL